MCTATWLRSWRRRSTVTELYYLLMMPLSVILLITQCGITGEKYSGTSKCELFRLLLLILNYVQQ